VIVVAVAALITIALTLRTQTGRRFWAGQLLDPNLDQYNRSTFLTGDPTGVSRWTRASVAHRIVVRLAAVALLALYITGLIIQPALSVALCATTLAAILAWWGHNSWHWLTTRKLRNHVITPLFHGLRQTIGWDDGIKPTDVIIAGNDYHQTGVTLDLPDTFQRLDTTLENTSIIASRTLGDNWKATWDLVGQPTVHLQHTPEPPDQVIWDDDAHNE
jgi:hypothetical protein